MEDKQIKDIFSRFQPELSSSLEFMARLQKNMEAVEIVRQHNAILRRRNHIAVGIASVCGFVVGVALTLLFPILDEWVSSITISLPYLSSGVPTIDYSFIAWIIIAATSVITALNAYEIAMARLPSPHNRRR